MNPAVLLITETSEIGGGEINLLTIAEQLLKWDMSPFVVLPGEGPLADRVRAAGLPLDFVPRPPLFPASFLIAHRFKLPNPLVLVNLLTGSIWASRLSVFFKRFANSSPLPVVQTFSLWAHAFAGTAAVRSGLPLVWYFQDIVGARSGFSLYRHLLLRLARTLPQRILCLTEAIAAQFARDPEVAAKTLALPCVVDPVKFLPASSRRTNRDLTAPLKIGTVARLTPWKGQENALRVARLLVRRSVPFRWSFVGDEALGASGYRHHLLDLVAQWGLSDCVEFPGWLGDMPAYYRSIDVLVHLPNEPEPFGLVLAEAMASGLPVVAAKGGGAESMVAGAGGFLVPAHDHEAVAGVLVSLWRDPDERLRRGVQARKYAERTFSLDVYLDGLIAIYASLQVVP